MAVTNGRMSNVHKIRAVERQREVLKLRTQGLTFQEIADRLGYKGRTGVYDAFRKALQATIQEPADEARRVEVERLDKLIAAIWSEAMAGKLFAIDRVLMIMDRRAKLLGLDAPQKVDIQGDVQRIADQIGITEAEAVAIADQVIRESRR